MIHMLWYAVALVAILLAYGLSDEQAPFWRPLTDPWRDAFCWVLVVAFVDFSLFHMEEYRLADPHSGFLRLLTVACTASTCTSPGAGTAYSVSALRPACRSPTAATRRS